MRTLFFLPLILLVVILAVGCQNDPYPVESGSVSLGQPTALGQFYLPAGATLESAKMYICVALENNQTVDIHRVTAPWDEATITWNTFGGAYDATIVTSFNNNVTGWISIDVTSLVQDWLDGTYPNYGLLMDQIQKDFPRAKYFAREDNWFPPYLEVCYTTSTGTVCENVPTIADAFIWELNPDMLGGASALLYTGWLDETDMEKQSLLMFDIEPEPFSDDGCTCARVAGATTPAWTDATTGLPSTCRSGSAMPVANAVSTLTMSTSQDSSLGWSYMTNRPTASSTCMLSFLQPS